MKDKKAYAGIVITGAVIGLIAVALVLLGNPKNMGFCIACFLRDIAGATKLHTTGTVQYFRPEIVGLVGGALAMALIGKEFSPKGGSAPVTRFFLGAFVMIGALVFLGCPLRMVLRIGGGDLNAVVGLVGFACGILGGIFTAPFLVMPPFFSFSSLFVMYLITVRRILFFSSIVFLVFRRLCNFAIFFDRLFPFSIIRLLLFLIHGYRSVSARRSILFLTRYSLNLLSCFLFRR